VLVSLLLSSTSPLTGAVSVTDIAGNKYSLDKDVNDGSDGDRVLLFSSSNVAALPVGATLKLTYPKSAEYHVTVDEYTGVGAVDRAAGASGRTSAVNSTSITSTQPGELVRGVIANESGNTPTFTSGWISRPVIALSTDHLATADQVQSAAGSVAVTGSATGVWMSAVVAYQPVGTSPPPPVDVPPVAVLSVSPVSGNAPLLVTADSSGSTVGSTPIASYQFNFGDGSAVVSQAGATAQHTYGSAGTFTVSVTATDTANKSSSAVTKTVTVNPAPPPPPPPPPLSPVVVWGGYMDDHHPGNLQPKPVPWQGSSNVVFVGQPDSSSGGWDTSTVRVDNVSAAPLVATVTVDIGSDHFALWGTQTLPAGNSLIVAQMGYATFDGSDLNPGGCYGCGPQTCTPPLTTVPVVHVTIGSTTYNFFDRKQILDTHGVDSAGCPYNGNRNDESEPWQVLSTS
jgi:PKD repeat protein